MINFESQSVLFDFDWVRKKLSFYTLSEPGKKRAESVAPLSGEEARLALNRVEELKNILDSDGHLPLSQFPDIINHLYLVEKPGACLHAGEIFEIKLVLEIAAGLNRFYEKRRDSFPCLAGIFEKLHTLHLLRKALSNALDERGEIRDDASRELREIRKQKAYLNKKLQKSIEKLQRFASEQQWMHEDNPTIRDGRLVLPLKTEHKRKIKGVIHGQSATGLTTFVEPLEIVEINNEIMDAALQEKEEIRRILKSLCDEIRAFLPEIKECFHNLVELDFYNACALMAKEMNAVKPEISSELHLQLNEVRNPVLSSTRDVVPLTLRMDGNMRIILITGPNAGGKTVVIKTVALLSAMGLSGLFIPGKEPLIIPEFDNIFVDIGDQQSIMEDLSTFSSHLENIRFIMKNATARSLIVLDEIGTGTDPSEGAALAQSILERLNSLGALTLATTHHGMLKAFAQETPGILNAAMEFDLKDLSPTYRLRIGVPGSSYALEISRRLGLPEDVLWRAAELVGSQNTELSSLLTRLEEALQKNREKENELERRKRTLDRLIGRYEEKQNLLNASLKKVKEKKVSELDSLLSEANKEIERIIREIRESQASTASIKQSRDILKKLRQKSEKEKKKIVPPQSPVKSYKAGDWVKVIPFDSKGVIINIAPGGKRITVDVEGKTLKVKPELLLPAKAPKKSGTRPLHMVDYQKPGSLRLDIRGFRVDEARMALDKFLNNSLLAGLKQVEILHGKGTGALQSMVHEELARFPAIKSFRFAPYETGGPGITEVEFQD